ncbi:MAG: hypothetical protein IJL37_02690 [Bacteroidaceae bacterium]|nr:hypothetical protein [Bacteroidaceae bacterium]
MKELIKNWFRLNNNHPEDDNRFYEIVIQSIDNKIGKDVFEAALREVSPEVADDEISAVYCRYEDIRCFLVYYVKKGE